MASLRHSLLGVKLSSLLMWRPGGLHQGRRCFHQRLGKPLGKTQSGTMESRVELTHIANRDVSSGALAPRVPKPRFTNSGEENRTSPLIAQRIKESLV